MLWSKHNQVIQRLQISQCKGLSHNDKSVQKQWKMLHWPCEDNEVLRDDRYKYGVLTIMDTLGKSKRDGHRPKRMDLMQVFEGDEKTEKFYLEITDVEFW